MTDRLVRDDVKGPAAAKAVGRHGLILAGCWLLLGLLGWFDYDPAYASKLECCLSQRSAWRKSGQSRATSLQNRREWFISLRWASSCSTR